jgi:glycosyltransferase involved in cell wall biosynthesis
VPAHQAVATIAESVSSALSQTLAPLEVVVCDDGSTDDLVGALEPFSGRITLLRQQNAGAAAARNRAVRAASGEFVVFLDSDDVLHPAYLEALAELAATEPDLDLLSTDVFFEKDGQIVGRFYEENEFAFTNQRRAILSGCFVGWPAVRRARLLAIGGFDESLLIASDWDAWIRVILDGGRAGLVAEPQRRYRLRPHSLSADRTRSLRARVAVLDRAAENVNLRAEEREPLAAARRDAARRAKLAELQEALQARTSSAHKRALSYTLARGVPLAERASALRLALGGRKVGALAPSASRDERAPDPTGRRRRSRRLVVQRLLRRVRN